MIDDGLEYPWDIYASLQKEEDGITRLGYREKAVEDKLNSFLDAVANGSLSVDAETRSKKLVNIEINRQKKYRNRDRLLENWAATCLAQYYTPEKIILSLEIEQQLEAV